MNNNQIPECLALIGDELYYSSKFFEDKEIPKPKGTFVIDKYLFIVRNKIFLLDEPIFLQLDSSKVAPIQNAKDAVIAAGFVLMDLDKANKIIKKIFSKPELEMAAALPMD